MKRNTVYLIFVIIVSLCGVLLRGMNLLFAYEPETLLPIKGHWLSIAMTALTAAVIIIAVAVGYKWFQQYCTCTFEQVYGSMSGILTVLCMAAGAGTSVFSLLGTLSLREQLAEQYIVMGSEVFMPSPLITGATALAWVLGFASGICMLLFPLRQRNGAKITKYTGLLVTVPMFWCCIDLIIVYHENSGNPVLSEYSYMLINIVAVMAAFYGIGSFLYEAKPAAPQFFAAAGISVYLSFMQMGGTWLWNILASPERDLIEDIGIGNVIRIMVYLCTGIYLLLQLAHAALTAAHAQPNVSAPNSNQQ